jgi:2-polyprenyl-3-methyl-5-hydroxy-6-metoxy-1,4-benzoquinol methylase
LNTEIVSPKNDLVLVGVPLERFVIPEFMENRDAIMAALGSRAVGVTQTKGHRVDRSRDTIVQIFLEHPDQPDWLLFLDSDMTFPVDIGLRLLSAHKPVIGGLYFHRGNHNPFVMTESSRVEDQFGRLARSWEFERELVANFLNNAGLPMRDGAVAIDGADGRIHPCDAIGTGCMLIHRSVFEQMEAPWFEYGEHAQSEDLSFCWRVKHELDTQVYVDLGSVCEHFNSVAMGHAQFRSNYKVRGIRLSEYSVGLAGKWLEEFAGYEDGQGALANYSPDTLKALWEERSDGTRDIDFYMSKSVGEQYLLDLLRWNGGPMFAQFKDVLVGLEGINALVIGSGVGSLAIQLALQKCNVSAFEANGVLRKFAKKRWEWTKENKAHSSFGDIEWNGAFRRGTRTPAWLLDSVDIVVAIDVFEHMPEEALNGAFYYLSSRVKRGGRVFFHNNWKQQDIYPMHHDHSDIWEDIVESYGFFQLDDFWLVKVTGEKHDNEES